ncbi:MAG: urease accessory protein UreD [Verrucomicrobiota bacterium JB022]|nr:urease accessory protein UreD [Verrucomicrobiota bacterium JB022]
MTPEPPSRGRTLQGGLWAEVAPHEGVARLQRCRHAAPAHVSKPSWQGGHLLLQVNCPSTGLFGGDSLTLDVKVREGAAMTLTSQAAMRIHPMHAHDQAEAINRFDVCGADSWLEYWPEATVLQAEANFQQHTQLDCRDGGEALVLDVVWPGRLRRGEAFRFGRYHTQLDVQLDESLALRERGRFDRGSRARAAWQRALTPAVQCTVVLVTRRDVSKCAEALHAWDLPPECLLGATALPAGGLAVRVLSRNLRELPRLLQRLRSFAYETAERPEPSLRRLLA